MYFQEPQHYVYIYISFDKNQMCLNKCIKISIYIYIQGVYSLILILQFKQSFGLTPKPQIIIFAITPKGKNSETIVP